MNRQGAERPRSCLTKPVRRVAIADGRLSYARRTQAIEHEAELDGLYVIRTLKGVDLQIRPIYHCSEERVRAHIFLCLLAYYVEWHMRQALATLLFDDETLEFERKHRSNANIVIR